MPAFEEMRQCKIYPRSKKKEIWQRANDGWTQPEEKKRETCARRKKIILATGLERGQSSIKIIAFILVKV